MREIGTSDGSQLVKEYYGDMPIGETGWGADHARFKTESNRENPKPQVNIQLGKGSGVNIFNDNLIAFEVLKK